MTPKDRKYAETHEWVKIEGDRAVVGITDHAQQSLGDVTFVELPAAGAVLKQGDVFGVIESVKAASDLFAPLNGTVAEVNGRLEDAPELVNEHPYGDGWIIKLKDFDGDGLAALLDAGGYERTIA